ncbi:hypothetical protein AN220_30360, partial [Streptomyces nanshensis]
MVVVFVLIVLVVLGLLAGTHLYLWRRFVRDVSAPGSLWRRLGTVLAVLLPVTTLGALVSGRAGAPFLVEQILAWPGFLWLACLLYLTLALLAGELVRFVLRRTPWGRARSVQAPAAEPAPAVQESARVAEPVTPAGGPS